MNKVLLPTTQVTIGVAMGAATVIGAWLVNVVTGTIVPAEVAVSASVLLTFGAQYYWGPNRASAG